MLSVLISWIYIFLLCLATGCILLALLEKITNLSGSLSNSPVAVTTIGMMAITVYAEYFSIFYKVGAICHLVFLAAVIITLSASVSVRKSFLNLCCKCRNNLRSWTGLGTFFILLLLTFASSRGTFHTDTRIYHAQTIRIIEEYGVVKGIGNLQLHFGYNSAYLVFCAFFTGSWILPEALHTTTGFLAALYTSYAIYDIVTAVRCKKAESCLPCAARVGILIYIFTNFTGLMSPATDYGTMLVTGYIISAWADLISDHPIKSALSRNFKASLQFTDYCTLSLLALFTASMKLSAAFLVLLVIWPVITGILHKQVKALISYLTAGFITFLPYLIRNVIISGWLFYPVTAIDLFDVKWKVPQEYALADSQQISVWGKCLYDITKANLPLSEWFPIWWSSQEHYAQMLIYANILALVLFLVSIIMRMRNGCSYQVSQDNISSRYAFITLIITLYINTAIWFFTAPFIRYGLIYLLMLPLFSCGLFLQTLHYCPRMAFWKIPGALLTVCIPLCFCAWLDHYTMDDLVYLKHNISQPYYIQQQPFDHPIEQYETINGCRIYYAEGGYENNSYYETPSTCYKTMLDRTTLIGNTIKEGFMPR